FGVDAAEEFKEKHAKCLMILVKDLALNGVNAASTLVFAAGQNYTNSTNNFSAAGPSNPAMLNLEDLSQDADDVGAEADINNMESIISVSPILTTRIHKDHPTSQIIGDLSSTTQTRSMARGVRDQGGISQMFNEDFHVACFHVVAAAKLPILNPKEFDLWKMRIEQKNELKARGTLLMALPDKHQLKFNIHKDAKSLMEAIEKRFGGNKETKKVQKTLLRQQYENFNGSSSKSTDQIHDRLQKLISQLEILDLEDQRLDDVFNNLKIYEAKVKSSSFTSSTTQNIAFVSSHNTDSTNESVSAVTSVSAASTKVPVFALPNVDNLNDDDLEEVDLKWQMAMLTMRARRRRHFTKECRSPKDTRNKETQRRNVPVETSTSNALVSQCDGVGSYYWSFQVDEEPTNYALMAFTSSSSSSSDNEVTLCLESVEARLVVYQQNENVFEEDIKLLKLDVMLRDNALVELRKKFEKAEQDKDELGYDNQVFNSTVFDCDELVSSESDVSMPTSLVHDRYKSGEGYHDVPPPYIGTFIPPKPNLVFHDASTACETVPTILNVEPNESEGEPMPTQRAASFVQTSKHEKTPRTSFKPVEHSIPAENLRTNILKSKEINEGYVAFGGNLKGGKITGKGIKREFSVARTPQLNGIAEERIGSVLVTKPHNKTPYELLLARTPSLGFMRPFGYLVTILNTLDPLGSSLAWLFDIDTLTQSMNYQPVVAGNQPNSSVGVQENLTTGTSGKEGDFVQQYVLLPLWSSSSKNPQNTDADAFEVKEPESKFYVSLSSGDKIKKHDEQTTKEANGKSPVELSTGVKDLSDDFEEVYDNSTNGFNAASTSVTTVWLNSTNSTNTFSAAGPSNTAVSLTFGLDEKSSFMEPSQYLDDPDMPEEGIDYEDVFAPVARIEAMRLFLAYASLRGFMVYQMDVKSSFLYGTIKEEVYVCQPLGFKDPDYPDKVCKVVKALYGLHQAPRAWYETLANYLLENDGKLASTPINTKNPLLKNPDGGDVDVYTYRSMIGSLMYLTSSRPDIMFAICACAYFQVTPKDSHLHVVKRSFRYLKGKTHLGLSYPKDSPFNLVAYSNSDYAAASLDRKSTTWGCQFLDELTKPSTAGKAALYPSPVLSLSLT
nr:hypothetical protein [Tanacetum cinerariifolium]